MARVTLTGVTRTYGGAGAAAVNGIDLVIEEGEFFVLLGPSGCGKSTLLRMIAGLEPVDEGTIRFDEQLVNYATPGQRNVAMVFQNYALYPQMSVRDNIAFPLKMRKVKGGARAESVRDAARALELDQLLDRPVAKLSGGQKQRVALARAIVRNPAVMLMDEPLSNLDALLRSQTRENLLELHETIPGTVVYVTHDQVEAMTMGDRVAVMRNGEIVQLGTPREVYRHPADRFVAGFIGSPAMNFVDGELQERDGAPWFAGGGLACRLDGRRGADGAGVVTLGVRPEAVELAAGEEWGVQRTEFYGVEQIVTVEREGTLLRARIPLNRDVAVGERFAVELDPRDIHLFGPDGRSLGAADTATASAPVRAGEGR